MREIPLTQGKVALVDDADFDWLNQWKWCAMKVGKTHYAVRNEPRQPGKKRKLILMHREIAAQAGLSDVDHENHAGLDNQRHNLRPCTRAQNMANMSGARGRSGFRGISWQGRRKN